MQQQFFPDSTRPELLVDLKLTEGASLTATEDQAKKLEAWLAKRPELENYVELRRLRRAAFLSAARSATAAGELRRVRPADQESTTIAKRLRADLIDAVRHDFTELRARVLRLENGPPVGYPVQFRVSGADIPTVRELARKVADVMRKIHMCAM